LTNHKNENGEASRDTAHASADDIRRKILKMGAVGLPLVVSLKSGTAWAVSTCATQISRPTDEQIDAALSDPTNIATITNTTTINTVNIAKIVEDYNEVDAGQPFPDSGVVDSGEVLWLLLNTGSGGSCWASFCNNAIETGDIIVVGKSSNQVCGGSNNGFGNGDQEAPGGSGGNNGAENDP
jgi:hypothetical protein